MPLSPEEKRKLLQDAGYDPDQFDIIPEADYQASKRSTLGVVGTELGSQVGGLAGAASAATLASPLLEMSVGPQAAVTLPAYAGAILLGGLGGGKLQDALENAYMSPEGKAALNEKRAANRTQNPKRTMATDLGSQLLLGRPSPAVLGKAASGAGKLISGAGTLERALNPAEINALKAVGAGAGLGAGIEGANQVMQGHFDPGALAAQTAIGGLATEPTMLAKGLGKFVAGAGNKIVGRDIFAEPKATDLNDVARELPAMLHVDNEGKIVSGIKPKETAEVIADPDKVTVENNIVPEEIPTALRVQPEGGEFDKALGDFRNQLAEQGYKSYKTDSGEHFLAPDAAKDYEARIANKVAPEEALKGVLEAGHKNPLQLALEEVRGRTEEPAKDIFANERGELEDARVARQIDERQLGVGDQAKAITRQEIAAKDSPVEQLRAMLEGSKPIKSDVNITAKQNEAIRLLRKQHPQANLQDIVNAVKSKTVDTLGGEKGQAAEAPAGTPIDDYTRQFAVSRGLDVATAAEPLSLVSDPATRLAGKTFDSSTEAASKGIVGVDPAVANPDTASHELLHTAVRAMAALAENGDAQAARVYKAITSAAGGEEAVVQASGVKLAKLLEGKEKGANALDMLATSLRFRLGGEVTPERLSSYLANLTRSTGANLGKLSQIKSGEQAASIYPPILGIPHKIATEKGRSFGDLWTKVATGIDSPLTKLESIGNKTPEMSAVTNYAIARLRNNVVRAKELTGTYETAYHKIIYGDDVKSFFIDGLPGGDKIAEKMTGLTEEKKRLINDYLIIQDKMRPLVPKGTSTELSLEPIEGQRYAMERLKLAEADPLVMEKAKAIQDNVYIPVQQDSINAGMLVNDNGVWRQARSQGDYSNAKLSRSLAEAFIKRPGETESQAGKKYIHDYWLNREVLKATESGLSGPELTDFIAKTKEKVASDFDDYIKAIGGGYPSNSPQYFAALGRAAGRGLPIGAIEPDLSSRINGYIRRSANAIAFHENVQADPHMRAILNIPDQTGSKTTNNHVLPDGTIIDNSSNAVVHSGALSDIIGAGADFPSTAENLLKTVGRGATSSWMGFPSGLRDIASSIVRDFAYLRAQDLPSIYYESFKNFGKFFGESFEMGVNKSQHSQLEFGEATLNSGLETINNFSNFISQIQGRDLLEKVARGWAYGKGRAAADLFAAIPEGQNPVLDRLWNILASDTPGLSTSRGTPAFNELAKKRIAARYTEAIQGTYDIRNLPAISQKGPLSLAFTLQRWNLEMMNRFRREMIAPTLQAGKIWNQNKTDANFRKFQGELQPLVQYTLAAVLGGVGIKEMTQLLTNRLSEQPTNDELRATKHDTMDLSDPQVMSKWITNMETAGYAGFLGQSLSTVVNSLMSTPGRGDFGSLPVYEFASSTASTIRDFITSIETPEDIVNKLPILANQLAKNNLQNYRSIIGYADSELSDSQDARRNQRVFSRLSGDNVPAPQRGNAFADTENKNLDTARTPEDAKAALMAAVEKLKIRVAAAKTPEEKQAVLASEIRKIKLPAKSYFPSTDNPKLGAFINFLKANGQLVPQVEQEKGRERNKAMTGR